MGLVALHEEGNEVFGPVGVEGRINGRKLLEVDVEAGGGEAADDGGCGGGQGE